MSRNLKTILWLSVGVLSISSAAIIIRLASAPALTVAFYRMGFSVLLLSPVLLLIRQQWPTGIRLPRNWLFWIVISGFFLALHFACWIESLNHTSITSSVLLVTMNPIFLSIASPLLLKERLDTRMLLAIPVSLLGAAIVALRGGNTGLLAADNLKGNALALAGAIAYSGYLLVGRKVRRTVPILSYSYLTYLCAAFLLLAGCLLGQQPLHGFPRSTWRWLLLLALLPQLLGHTSFNWALRHLSAPRVSLVILAEPVGASLLAWLVFQQQPTAFEIVGGTLILCGIALAGTGVSTGRPMRQDNPKR